MYCKKCGVELEDDVLICPLCGTPVGSHLSGKHPDVNKRYGFHEPHKPMNEPQKKFTWEIVSIILLSATIGAVSIDFIINRHMSWSVYPVAINLVIFSYISLFAFWNVKTVGRLIGCFVLSSFFLASLDLLISGINWSVTIGIPLLFTANLVAILLIAVIRLSRFKGINLIAYGFVAAAIQSVFVDSILSFSKRKSFHLGWSLIVVACVIPVVLILLFLHFRLKRGRRLARVFHS